MSLRPCRQTGQRAAEPASGFTLLEVMIALAIVAVALVTLLGLTTRSLTLNERVQRITQATLLAQQRLAEIETGAAQEPPGEAASGHFSPPFDGYRWRVNYVETPLAAVRQVTVAVIWGKEEKNEAVELSSFLFRPRGAR